MEEALLLLIMGAINLACFNIGAKVGQTVAKGKDIEGPAIPIKNPLETFREREATREAQREAKAAQDKYSAIMRNIENYDGTSSGQEDIPGR